jgi:hypothetical protein
MPFAARSVKESIQGALGPEGEAAEIKVGLTSIEILDVRIRAPKGWPSDSTLRARRIVIVPLPGSRESGELPGGEARLCPRHSSQMLNRLPGLSFEPVDRCVMDTQRGTPLGKLAQPTEVLHEPKVPANGLGSHFSAGVDENHRPTCRK